MDSAGLLPEEELSLTDESGVANESAEEEDEVEPRGDLGVFTDFVEGLDLDNLLGN